MLFSIRCKLESKQQCCLLADKGCLALCVDNMQQVQELTPLEKVEMCHTVFCFLKDSSDKSRVLLDEFRSCQGYIFLADFVSK